MIFINIIYKYLFLVILFFSISVFECYSQNSFSEESFFNDLYSFNLNSAYKKLNGLDNKADFQSVMLAKAYYFSFLNDIESTKTNEDSSVFFSKNLTNIILKKNKLSGNEYFNIIAAQAVLFKFEINKGNYFSAFINFLKTDEYMEFILKNSEKNDKYKFVSGLYFYYAWLAKSDYPALYPILMFYPQGNRTKGLEILAVTSKSKNIFVRTQSRYFLARINRRDEKKYEESKKYFLLLIDEFPENILWRYEFAECLKYFGKFDEMEIQKKTCIQLITRNKQITVSQKKIISDKIKNL